MLIGEQIQHGASLSIDCFRFSLWRWEVPLSENEEGRQGTWRVKQKRKYKMISLEDGKFRKCRRLKEPSS